MVTSRGLSIKIMLGRRKSIDILKMFEYFRLRIFEWLIEEGYGLIFSRFEVDCIDWTAVINILDFYDFSEDRDFVGLI